MGFSASAATIGVKHVPVPVPTHATALIPLAAVSGRARELQGRIVDPEVHGAERREPSQTSVGEVGQL